MASSLVYPPAAPAVSGDDMSTVEIHRLLKSPTLIARRVRDLALNRYIADVLLKGRFKAVGGSILHEDGEPLFTNDEPEAVAPGAEYPITTIGGGGLMTAKTTNWGQDTEIMDATIARLGINPVNRGFTKLVNQSVSFIDSASLSVIASRITATWNATGSGNPGAWTDGDAIVEGVLLAKAAVTGLDEGFNPDVIVLRDVQWAKAIGRLSAAGLLPREASNPLLTGSWPEVLGLTWLRSNHTPTADPLLVDTEQLGGMADEDLEGPGYSRAAGVGVETKSGRLAGDRVDGYWLRARRVTVPVVLEPQAGIRLTNTGL